jgi:hypothetical protein
MFLPWDEGWDYFKTYISMIQAPWDILDLQAFPKLVKIGYKGLSDVLTGVLVAFD